MADKIIENNQVSIMGKIASGFTFSHQVFGEGFYLVDILVKRLSDSEDRIPLMVSERLVDVTQDYEGEYIMVQGQFRSYNRHEEKKNRLVLSVFQSDISGRLYLQAAGLPENAFRKGDCGPSAGRKPALRKIRLHTLYLLGKKCQIRLRL